jgi:hypothetical protein
MPLINTPFNPIQTLSFDTWEPVLSTEMQHQPAQAIESGQLLFFPKLSFPLTSKEQLLLSPDFMDKTVKNISYDAFTDRLKGACGREDELKAIKTMISRFFKHACALVSHVLPNYREALEPMRTSFRPAQVSHRKLSYRKDDRRLHVDAFPATPNQGKRLLRVFSNINPHGEHRVWRIGEPFETVARRFLPAISSPFPGSHELLYRLKMTKSRRTEYDHLMLQLHDRMKKDDHYQQKAGQIKQMFPPHTTWIVQTDQVSHAAMSGQYLLEQTFYLPVDAMLDPERSPLKILERLTGRILA